MSTKARQTFCHTLRGESINQGRLNHILTSEAHVTHLGGNPWRKLRNQPLRPRPAVPLRSSILRRPWPRGHQLTKRAGEALLGDLVGLITKHLKKGERIRIAGLGILQVRKRAARMGRNPATREAIKIKASKKVAFRAAKELKLAV